MKLNELVMVRNKNADTLEYLEKLVDDIDLSWIRVGDELSVVENSKYRRLVVVLLLKGMSGIEGVYDLPPGIMILNYEDGSLDLYHQPNDKLVYLTADQIQQIVEPINRYKVCEVGYMKLLGFDEVYI